VGSPVKTVLPPDDVTTFELKLARVARAAIEAFRKTQPIELDSVDRKLIAAVRHRLDHPTAEIEPDLEAYLFTAIVLSLSVDIDAVRRKS